MSAPINYPAAYPAETLELSKAINLEQGSAEWLAWRQKGIGASDLSAILGMSQYETPLSLWAKKTGFISAEIEQNENMEWGHRIEPVLVDKWIEENSSTHSLVARGPVFERTDLPWLRASLDCIVSNALGELQALECKTAGSIDEWVDELGNEIIPAAYMAQAIHQMAATGIRVVHFSVLIMGRGRQWISRTVTWDDDQVLAAVEAAKSFWGLVERNEAPEISWVCPEADSKAIKALYPSVNDDEVFEAGEHGEQLIDERARLKKESKALEDRIDVIENEIKMAMGSAKVAKANGRKVCTASAYDMTSVDSKKLQELHPAVYAECSKVTPIRKWLFTK